VGVKEKQQKQAEEEAVEKEAAQQGHKKAEEGERSHKEQGPQVVEAGLLPGWAEEFDESSGQTYWYNEDMDESSWERPVAQQPATAEVAAAEPVLTLEPVVAVRVRGCDCMCSDLAATA
jgi:hypothetical protein